jgi:hypothetical protein
MHLGTIEITGKLGFECIQFMILLQNFLILQDLLILILEQ